MSKKAILFGVVKSFSAEAQQFFDRLLTPPTPARAALYAALIDGLVAGGVWTKLDVLMVGAAFDISTSFVNLVSGSFYGNILSPGVTFTQDRGWTTAGIFDCVTSNYNPSTAAGLYTQNSANLSVWAQSYASPAIDGNGICVINGTLQSCINLQNNPPSFVAARINDSTGFITSSFAASTTGLFSINRSGATASQLYLNGSPLGSSANSSAAVENADILIGVVPNDRWAAYTIGGSLTAGEQTDLYNALHAYMVGVGAA